MQAQPKEEGCARKQGEEESRKDSSSSLRRKVRALIAHNSSMLGRGMLLLVGLCTIAVWGRAEDGKTVPPVASQGRELSLRDTPAPPPLAPSAHAPPPCAETRPSAAPESEKMGLVDLNTATERELRSLPGVGAKKAAAILALREKLGRFRKVSDLLRVKGIGPKMLNRWKDRLTVGTTSAERAAANQQ